MRSINFRGSSIYKHCTLFPFTRFLSHWVFPGKVFNEAVPKQGMRQLNSTQLHTTKSDNCSRGSIMNHGKIM